MGCMADYSEEDLRLMESVRGESKAEITSLRNSDKFHKKCSENYMKQITSLRKQLQKADSFVKEVTDENQKLHKKIKELTSKTGKD